LIIFEKIRKKSSNAKGKAVIRVFLLSLVLLKNGAAHLQSVFTQP